MFGLGLPELLIILLVILMFFGAKYLPQLSKNVGESGRAFKEGFTDGKNDKSLKDIAKEVNTSARKVKSKIKEGVDTVKNPHL